MNFILSFACFLVLCGVCICDKYDKRSNSVPETFKMGKIKAVWDKAQKVLKGPTLADLYAELVIQEKRERELKQKMVDGFDPDGLFEADVRRKLVGLLSKYGLNEYFPSEKYAGDLRQHRDQYQIRDERLKKLMKRAEIEGFTAEEMATLREEMGHQQMKLEEFNALKMDYDTLQEQVDNSLDNVDEQENLWQELADKKHKLKNKHRLMREDLQVLQKKVESGSKQGAEFQDSRVYQLWALAQKSGMDEAELASFKKELTHFDHRIKKSEYIQEQVDAKARLAGEDSIEHKELRERGKQYNRKVEKFHEELKERIQRRIEL